MKAWAEGFRVHSRGAPGRELRPPKTSLAKAPGEGRSASDSGGYARIAMMALGALGAFFLLFLAAS